MTHAPRPTVALADAAAALAAAGVADAERRALLAHLLATRGDAAVATAVHNVHEGARGSLLAAVVDDRPFLLDTLLAAVRRSGHTVRAAEHPVLTDLEGIGPTAAIVLELERRLEPELLEPLEDAARGALSAACAVVDEFPAGASRVQAMSGEIAANAEVSALLDWMLDDHIVLLGVARYELHGDTAGVPVAATGLLSAAAVAPGPGGADGPAALAPIAPPEAVAIARLMDGADVAVHQLAQRSPVHRDARMHELLIPEHGGNHAVMGFGRVLYLLTHRAESAPASEVPVLRERLARALERSGLRPGSHDHKQMVALYDAMPKEELLAIDDDDLLGLLRALMAAGPDELVLRARPHGDGHGTSLVVAVPQDRLTPHLRDQVGALVMERYGTSDVVVHEVIGDDTHLQLHVGVHDPHGLRPIDLDALRQEIDRVARTWMTGLRDALIAREGDEHGRLLAAHWGPRLSEPYRAAVPAERAVDDVLALEHLRRSDTRRLVALREEQGEEGAVTRIALLTRGRKAELSQVISVLEDLGLTVLEERPTHVTGAGDDVWIQDFGVLGPDGGPLALEACGDRVRACVEAVFAGEAESDALHRLVITTELDHTRLEVLRAYRRYRTRIGSRYTESFQNQVIVDQPETTAALVRLFELRFDPRIPRDDAAEQQLRTEILAQIDAMPSLDHDRILRNQLGLVDATVRTNAYVAGRHALSLKFRASEVPALPQPAPMWEVYVYAPHMEGVHLRGGMIARGGLRWSDREDFRTEVFGLMRAQMVKNAVIVPTGAKGGFRLRQTPEDPAELRAAVESAYVDYIHALLDLSDTRSGSEIVPPADVVCRDGEDPYLVVAADKGTATFSDTANGVARERGFWLDDAFASGGSHGYDHKALGITARGAWESVKRHFREIGVDPEADPISVVGIGDMSGDVFGNGLLRSRTVHLIGAYDHRHIFLDPNPADAEAAFGERQRLFALPRSSWADYNTELISEGGGVWPRTMKSIPLSPQVRERLGVEAEELPPSELIRAMLRAEIDLLWNGGIGTVVKASTESDADAQDRSSESIRVNANELRCRVVGEGGNLGFTHRARIEFAAAGGAINADFIDNSAGVDCSDHEVNLKILLGEAIRRGDLDMAGRDALLEECTDEVCAHVLADSYRQARGITEEQRRSPSRLAAYEELMLALEEHSGLVRTDHDLPTSDVMHERIVAGQGMTRPELSVLLSLAKIAVTAELLESPLVDDRALEPELLAYFPGPVVERFGHLVWDHPLRRELLATLLAGDVVDTMGQSFVFRRALEFGATPSAVVRGFLIARDVCDAPRLIGAIEGTVHGTEARWEMNAVVQDAIRQVSRWYLTSEALSGEDLVRTVSEHRAAAAALRGRAEEAVLGEAARDRLRSWEQAGASTDLARDVASCGMLPLSPFVADIAGRTGRTVAELVTAVDALREELPLDTLQSLVAGLPSGTQVTRWANQALRDDYLAAVSRLAGLALAGGAADPGVAVRDGLAASGSGVRRLALLVREAHVTPHTEVAGTTLAVRQLREIADAFERRQS